MSGACYIGIRCQEIESAARALQVPYDVDLLDSVRVIEGAAAKVYNAQKG